MKPVVNNVSVNADTTEAVTYEVANMVEEENQYLRHIMTGQNKLRREYFINFIDKNRINYNKNLDNMIEIQFDTNLKNFKEVKKPRIYLFLLYFGQFPNYFQLYLDSVSINNDLLTIIILTDINVEQYKIPENVIIINMNIYEIRKRLALFLQNEYNENVDPNDLLTYNYKLCDIRPIYFKLFDDIITKYNIDTCDYVGWGDCDIIYGKLLFLCIYI
jgi:hypothetical protein